LLLLPTSVIGLVMSGARPRLVRLGASIAVLAVAAGCAFIGGDDLPTTGDALPALELTHPAAHEIERHVNEPDSGRNVDGGVIANPLRITRELMLDEPISGRDLFDWYRGRLTEDGWASAAEAYDLLIFQRLVEERFHSVILRAARDASGVTAFTVEYAIDVD
jgi:hypothetical protein